MDIRKFTYFFMVCCGLGVAQASVEYIIHPTQIKKESSQSAQEAITVTKIILDKENPKQKETAEMVEKNLGSYAPPAILALGTYYFVQKNYEKAILYYELGKIRTGIDIRICCDKINYMEVIMPIYESVGMIDMIQNLKETDKKGWLQYLNQAENSTTTALQLDAEIPRNYDSKWILLFHSANDINNYVPSEYEELTKQKSSGLSSEKSPEDIKKIISLYRQEVDKINKSEERKKMLEEARKQ